MQEARAIKDSGIHGRVSEIRVEFPSLVIHKLWQGKTLNSLIELTQLKAMEFWWVNFVQQ